MENNRELNILNGYWKLLLVQVFSCAMDQKPQESSHHCNGVCQCV